MTPPPPVPGLSAASPNPDDSEELPTANYWVRRKRALAQAG
jgi:hypothetical protein